MGGVAGPEFAAALERNRELYNARFAHARRTIRGLSSDDFKQYLVTCVEPTVVAAASTGASANTIDRLTDALYDVALEIVGANLAGPGGRYPVLSHTWRELFPRVVRLFDDAPRDGVAALTNAVVNLSAEPGIDAQRWLDRMLDLEASATTLDELLGLGQVLAWTTGMAHYRPGAVAVLDSLPPTLVEAIGIDAGSTRERWPTDDASKLRVVARLGDFVGLGGAFDGPPEVIQAGGQLFAFDNRACWTLHADRFGATLKRYGLSLPEAPPVPARYRVDGEHLTVDGHNHRLRMPAGVQSVAVTDEMAAFTLAHSHRVQLVALANA